MLAHLSRVVLMVRAGEGLAKASEFYSTLGLQVARATDEWVEFRTLSSASASASATNIKTTTSICLRAVTSESQLTTGYSPTLQFEVRDMDTIVAKCVQLGGNLDGPIQYPAHGKIAAIRSPCGHMIGLYEPAAA